MGRPRIATLLGAWIIVVPLGGCPPPAGPPADDTGSDSGSAAGSGPMGTTFTDPNACMSSDDCEAEGFFCVAPYDPGSDPPIGPGACVDTCIEQDDLARWCFDDDGCCETLQCNEVDGFCEPASGASSTSADSGSSGSSDSGSSDSGSSDSGSSDSGSSGSGSSGSSSST